MPRIAVLPELLANKIAAGEVIERPASVVKELVENSIDAGARCIEITVEQGGRQLIRVADDGVGMDAEDLALCVRPHATSKICRDEDLFAIRTLGFRGEALPSIGSVAELRIVSRIRGNDEACEIRVAGDRTERISAAAAPPGTCVEVRDLFFNMPARRKFLRTPSTEMGHLSEQLARIALVHPGIEFRLTHNGRLVHHLRPAQHMRSRIADFYGPDLADGLLEIARDERGLKLSGFAARPADSRSSAKWQYIFLNGRYIRDRFIAHAMREAYRGLIEPTRCPVVFLSLEVDPSCVDVNVHPTKSEVRWQDSNLIYSQVLSALRDKFLNTDLTPALRPGGLFSVVGAPPEADPEEIAAESNPISPAPMGGSAEAQAGDDAAAAARREQVRSAMADFFKRGPSGAPPLPAVGASRFAGALPADTVDSPVAQASPAAIEWPAPVAAVEERLAGLASVARPEQAIQVHRSYLVAESPDGLLIIDQHALHERILFEMLNGQLARGPLESQRLLIPEVLDVSPDQVGVIEHHEETLARLGFELSAYGRGSIAVHAAPSLLRPERTREFVRDMLDRLGDRQAPASGEMLTNDLLAMMACKAAVKAGDALSPEEIEALMAQRPQVERSSNCPHGRPTSLRLTLKDLERQFKRT